MINDEWLKSGSNLGDEDHGCGHGSQLGFTSFVVAFVPDKHGDKWLYYTDLSPAVYRTYGTSSFAVKPLRPWQRERERQTDRQTKRQRQRQTDRQTDRSELVGTFLMQWSSFAAMKSLPAPEIKTS